MCKFPSRIQEYLVIWQYWPSVLVIIVWSIEVILIIRDNTSWSETNMTLLKFLNMTLPKFLDVAEVSEQQTILLPNWVHARNLKPVDRMNWWSLGYPARDLGDGERALVSISSPDVCLTQYWMPLGARAWSCISWFSCWHFFRSVWAQVITLLNFHLEFMQRHMRNNWGWTLALVYSVWLLRWSCKLAIIEAGHWSRLLTSIPHVEAADADDDLMAPSCSITREIKEKAWGKQCFFLFDLSAAEPWCQEELASQKPIANNLLALKWSSSYMTKHYKNKINLITWACTCMQWFSWWYLFCSARLLVAVSWNFHLQSCRDTCRKPETRHWHWNAQFHSSYRPRQGFYGTELHGDAQSHVISRRRPEGT